MLYARLVVCKGTHLLDATMVLLLLSMLTTFIVLTLYHQTIPTLTLITLDEKTALTLSTELQSSTLEFHATT